MSLLAERLTVLAPDLLGHVRSAKLRADHSLGAHAVSIRDLLIALGHRHATAVGHSLGGVAMHFAYEYPVFSKRLVVVSSGGRRRRQPFRSRARLLAARIRRDSRSLGHDARPAGFTHRVHRRSCIRADARARPLLPPSMRLGTEARDRRLNRPGPTFAVVAAVPAAAEITGGRHKQQRRGGQAWPAPLRRRARNLPGRHRG
jgi:pimeloyl-ACP methyl ester carboxylesterase